MTNVRRFTYAFLTFFGASLLAGSKCVPYDAAVIGSANPTPLSECSEPGIAKLVVENFAYRIQCGCQETTGKTCTVPNGTTVVWQFADSTSHNVTAIANTFAGSTNLLAGTHEAMFDRKGSFDYGCSIHSYDMAGYQIVVADE